MENINYILIRFMIWLTTLTHFFNSKKAANDPVLLDMLSIPQLWQLLTLGITYSGSQRQRNTLMIRTVFHLWIRRFTAEMNCACIFKHLHEKRLYPISCPNCQNTTCTHQKQKLFRGPESQKLRSVFFNRYTQTFLIYIHIFICKKI